MRTLLIDADVIAFKIAAAIEKICCDDEGYIHYWFADAGEGRDRVDIYVNELVEDMAADEVVVCLSDPASHYFRHDIYPDYKGNRIGKLCRGWGIEIKQGFGRWSMPRPPSFDFTYEGKSMWRTEFQSHLYRSC